MHIILDGDLERMSPDGAQLAIGVVLVAISLIPIVPLSRASPWWEWMPPFIATVAIFIVGCYLVIGAFL